MQQHLECNEWQYQVGECCCSIYGKEDSVDNSNTKSGERDGMSWSKQDVDIKDGSSTGRKRAAKLYPLEPNRPCEWRNLKYAGGGLYPIYGCEEGLQQHRHHHDKDTLNNVPENVSRICTACHNTTHNNNDAFYRQYAGTVLWSKHDPDTKYIEEDLAQIIMYTQVIASRERFFWRPYDKSKDEYFIRAGQEAK